MKKLFSQPIGKEVNPDSTEEYNVDNPKDSCGIDISSKPHNHNETSINNEQETSYIPKPRFQNLRFFHKLLLDISPIDPILSCGECIIDKMKHNKQGNN